ncbi:MAG TPA: hypothetical protein VN769_01030, partial [Xanthobacteraceae bacterium]|nr:hypothetical protein [Xanthobacteraceae bacterium]
REFPTSTATASWPPLGFAANISFHDADPSAARSGICVFLLRPRTGTGRRDILRIAVAKAADAADSGHALFVGREPAIRPATVHAAAIIRTPRIILRFGAGSDRGARDESSE